MTRFRFWMLSLAALGALCLAEINTNREENKTETSIRRTLRR